MDTETYFIIYPQGDRSRISVVGLTPHMLYEITDYALASRKEFWNDHDGAIDYAKELAKENGKIYEGDGDGYLD